MPDPITGPAKEPDPFPGPPVRSTRMRNHTWNDEPRPFIIYE